jgi:hypothetical protein
MVEGIMQGCQPISIFSIQSWLSKKLLK